MAEQIAFRRKKIQDAERRSKGLPVPDESPPPLDSEDPDTPSSSSSGFNSNNSTATNYPISTISNNSNSNISLVSSSTNISVINRPSSTPKITATTTNSNSNTNATEMLLNNKNISQQISDVPAITNNDSPNVTSENSSSDRNNGSSSSSTTNCNNVSNKYTEPVRIDAIIHLKNLLRYQIDIHALLYVILKEVKSDVREAYRRIVEGQEEMRPLRALLTTPSDYTPQLPCNPLRLPIPLLPSLHQYRFHPYFKTAATVSPPYTYQIPRPDMFPCECIPKPDYKADLPINLHNDKAYSRSLEV